MSGPHAVPIWITKSETPEMTGVGTVTEEERAEGLLRLEPRSLVLDVELSATTTKVSGVGTKTETDELGGREIEIPFDDLVSATLRGGWWRPRIRLQASRLSALADLPGASKGVVEARVARRSRSDARALLTELEMARADLALERAQGSLPASGGRESLLGGSSEEPREAGEEGG